MAETEYFRPRNWPRFQHYRDRQPAWIKLHAAILRDFDFSQLTHQQQVVLIKVWLLYSQVSRPLPWSASWLGRQIDEHSNVVGKALPVLKSNNFIEICPKDASIMLAERKQGASLETETETETESPLSPPKGEELVLKPPEITNGPVNRTAHNLPGKKETVGQMVSMWNETLGPIGLPRVRHLTDQRIKVGYARFKDQLGEDLQNWQTLLYQIRASDFLAGRSERGEGHESWVCNFDFAVRSSKMAMILEGKYDNRQSQATERKTMAAASARSDGL